MERKIVTEYVHPPVPWRHDDWIAYFDGEEEDGPRGWGATKAEAIAALLEDAADDEETETAPKDPSFYDMKEE